MTAFVVRSLDRGATVFLALLAALAILVPLLNLLVPETWIIHVPNYLVSLFGKYICYALLALAIDLIWGYCGILSLGHGAFFALGGYAMGMYLMRQIGREGQYQSSLPDFMVFLDWKEFPWQWWMTDHFWWALLLALGLNWLYWLRVRLHFRLGCLNPAKVVATNPFTVAVFTDLATGDEGQYPVIKILRHPKPRGSSTRRTHSLNSPPSI